jgi:hypothetical protein
MVDPEGRLNPAQFPIEVWTREGEHLIFHEHRPESAAGPN